MRKIIGKKNKVHYVEETTRLQMVKSHKGWLVIGASMFALGLGGLVTSRPVSADVVATSTSSSAVRAETTSASSSSATKADSTSANNSSAVNAEMTGASSSSAVNAETTSASSSSAVNAETTSANNSSAVNAETTSASSSSAAKTDTASAASSSAAKTDTASAASSSAAKTDTASAASSSAAKTDTANAASSSAAKTDTASAASSSAAKTDTASAASSSAAKTDTASAASSSAAKSNMVSAVSSSAVLPSSGKVTVNRDNFDKYFNQNGSTINNYDKDTGIQTITNNSFQSGNVAFDGAIDVRNNFEIDGAINLGQITSNMGYTGIADGIGFVFYKGDRNQVGGNGGDLGIYGVTDAFGWKVDTWLNDSKHTNTSQVLHGDYDDGHTNPYGAFITTNKDGYGTIDQQSAQNLVSSIEDNNFHNIKFIYTAATQEFKIVLSTENGDVTFSKTFDYDTTSPAYYFTIAASTGALPTHQAFRIDSMTYSPIQKAIINYVDDTTGKTIASDSVTGDSEKPIDYSTASKISNFENQGYKLVKDGFLEGTSYDDDDTVDQIFEVHLTHGTKQASESQTVNETIHYVYKNGDKAADDYQATPLNFTRTVTTDKVTGATSNGDWVAANGTSFASVTSPTIKGYTPDQAQIDTITGITGDSADIEKTVTYVANKEAAKVTYIDDTTGKTLSSQDLSGDYETTDSYRTADSIKGYEDQGYELVSDNYPTTGVVYDQDGVVKSYEVHLTHGTKQTSESQTVNETIHYVYKDGSKAVDDHFAKPVEFTRQVSTDAVTGEKTYGAWSADQSFDAVTSPELKGYTADKAQIDKQTVNGDSKDLVFTVTYTKNAPTITTEKKTVNETIHYVYKDGSKAVDDHVAKPVEFTRQVSTDAVTGEKTYGAWSADQSFDAVTSPELKGYTADKAQIDKQTVNGDSKDLVFTVTYTKNAPTITTEKKTVNETIHYVYKDGSKAVDDHVAKPVEFTRQVSTDAVTGEKTYGAWSADQSFDAVTSPELKGYTADKAQIDKQTVNGDSKDLVFTVTYTKNAPTITTEKKTVNETIHYVYKDGSKAVDDHVAKPVEFTRQVSTDAVTGEKTYGAWSADQSFDAVKSPELKGYTADKAQIDKQTVKGDSKDLEFTVTYTKNAPTITTDLKHQLTPGNPSHPSNATNNGVINTSTNTGSKVNNGAVNSPELPQTGENNSQSQTMPFIGILLAMFGSLLGFLGIKKRRND
nr:hypothetical protein [Lactococcus lactis]ARE14709.2 hypothetical protein LLUC08_03790 [Lactococcus lactis subsp. lactis]